MRDERARADALITELYSLLAAMPYQEYLQTLWWRTLREEVYDRAGNVCQVCLAPGRLHAHHLTYKRRGHEHPDDLIALCEACHLRAHDREKWQKDCSHTWRLVLTCRRMQLAYCDKCMDFCQSDRRPTSRYFSENLP